MADHKKLDWRTNPKFYEWILENLSEFVLVKGPHSKLMWANKAFREYYGMSLEQLQDIVDAPHSDPDDTQQYVKDDLRVFTTAKPVYVGSEPVTDHKKVVRYFNTIKMPLFEGKEVVGSVGTSRPVENQAQEEEAIKRRAELRRSQMLEQNLALALEASQIGVWTWDIEQGSLQWEQNMYKLYGVEPGVTPSYELWEGALHEGDRDQVVKDLQKALEPGNKFEAQFRILVPTGDVRHIRALAKVIRNASGEPIRMIGVNWDVSAQVETQEKVENANETYRLVAQGASVGIWDWCDINGDKEIWTDKFYELLGYEPGEIVATLENFGKALHPEDAERTFAMVKDHFENNTPFDLEYRLKTKSGEYRWFKGSGQVSRNRAGNPMRMVGSIQDIHDRKLAQEALESANEELTQFSYRTSHDLKSPLLTVMGLSDVLIEEAQEGNTGEVITLANRIKALSGKLTDLVDDILNLTQSDQISESLEEIDFGKMLQDIQGKYDFLFKEKAVEIQSSFSHQGSFTGSWVRMLQVLQNLVSNSAKYCREDGARWVKVGTQSENGALVLTVEDNGRGIPPEATDKVFKMFSRFHPKESSGSGLGLYLVKKHVDKMGGKIEVDSDGNGTRFKLRFPYKRT